MSLSVRFRDEAVVRWGAGGDADRAVENDVSSFLLAIDMASVGCVPVHPKWQLQTKKACEGVSWDREIAFPTVCIYRGQNCM